MRRRNLLPLIGIADIFAHFYTPDDPAGGGGAAAKPADKPTDEPEKVTLTKAEIAAQTKAAIDAALAKERADAKAAKEKADADAAAKKAKDDGDLKAQADIADKARQEAVNKAVAAERRAQLAEVRNQVHEHLAADDARKPYLANAPDIMLHVEKALTADAKPEDVAKLIEKETKSFIERTGARTPTAGASPGAARGKLPAGTTVAPANGETKRLVGPAARF